MIAPAILPTLACSRWNTPGYHGRRTTEKPIVTLATPKRTPIHSMDTIVKPIQSKQ